VDTDHLVSTLDFTPTFLDAVKLPQIPDVDGRSFLPAIQGKTLPGWDRVFTMYNAAYGNRWIPMRSIRTKTASYIWNPWSDGKTIYQTENMAGLTWKAMLAASVTNAAIKARTDLYSYRVPEEFYDLTSDRFERKNLISDPARQKQIEAMRQELLALMRRTNDPFAEAFAQRDNREATVAVLKKLKEEYGKKGE
jgi:N-sulfoglucosamine sulfohydrolase